MKFTPEVLAALATLREHADSDFERHRIDVLERDLTAPPTVEIVADTHQRFNGETFKRRDGDGHYSRYQAVHRTVWQYYNGEIPGGCHIHHIDENKANNAIENLQCLTNAEHRKLHIELAKTTRTCIHCGKEFTVGERADNNGYCSSTCRIAHRYRLKENQVVRVCERCGKEFIAYKHSPVRFCSKDCRYADVQVVKKICPVCGKEFEQPVWRDNVCCSHKCAGKLMWQNKPPKDRKEIRQCAYCGKDFPVNKPTQKFCSKSCVMKYRYRKS